MRATRNYRALPFNPELKQRAKELRKAGMLHEALVWNRLKRRQLNGLDFDRQKIIGSYIVDFFCAEKGFVLELDGPSHDVREAHDVRRDAFLRSLGLTVVRVPVSQVLGNLDGVMEMLGSASPPRPGGHPSGGGEFRRVLTQIPLQWRGARRAGWSSKSGTFSR